MITKFSEETIEALKYYVYRLIDPRDGQTFYVGKGTGNRVFDHVKAELSLSDDETELTEKLQQIRDIRNSGLEVVHIIQRYGLSENTAFEVESALMDCFPGLTNIQNGHSSERGASNAELIEKAFAASEYEEPEFKYMIIKTSWNQVNACGGSVYEACRKCWVVDENKANQYPYVIAAINGQVKGVYKVNCWREASDFPGRKEFLGKEAEKEIQDIFFDKKIPAKYRKKGASNPIQYKK